MEQLIKNYEKMDWEDAPGYPAGTKIKVLRESDKEKTFILNLPPGFDMESHSHVCNEQHLVLDGSYISDNMAYDKGAYRYIPEHTSHGPFYSEDGAVILIIWDMNE